MSGFRVFARVALVCVVVGGGGLYLAWTKLGPGVARELTRTHDEAAAFGRANDQSACLDETFRRLRGCDGMLCEIQQPGFARDCLKNAAHAPDFCADVPDSIVAGVVWSRTTCPDADARPEICERVLREVLQVCMSAPDP